MAKLLPAICAASSAGLLAGGYLYASLWPQSRLFGETLIAGSDARQIALTFDDGPNEAATPQLLELLARRGVHATFFMMGSYVRQRPDLARAVRDGGHLIGNHTVTHPKLATCSAERIRRELADCSAAIEDVLGQRVEYFRPPFGARRPVVLRIARELGLIPVMWNATGFDWTDTPAERIAANLERALGQNGKAGRGTNMLLHDGGHLAMGTDRSRTVGAVELLIERHRPAVEFVTVDRWAAGALGPRS